MPNCTVIIPVLSGANMSYTSYVGPFHVQPHTLYGTKKYSGPTICSFTSSSSVLNCESEVKLL